MVKNLKRICWISIDCTKRENFSSLQKQKFVFNRTFLWADRVHVRECNQFTAIIAF